MTCPHLLRLTPGTVSRCVLLQLGRMPPPALAAARAVAVLGTAATRAGGRLAGLDGDVCAEAVGALMAERLVEGEQALRFVHPLVRSAVYQELAPPLRQRWHQRAARMLDGEGARAGRSGRTSAGRGPHRATTGSWTACRKPQRMPAAAAPPMWRRSAWNARWPSRRRRRVRGQVLLELGRVETMQAPASAVGHLTEALQVANGGPARRGTIALALAAALAMCGRFAEAVGTWRRRSTSPAARTHEPP